MAVRHLDPLHASKLLTSLKKCAYRGIKKKRRPNASLKIHQVICTHSHVSVKLRLKCLPSRPSTSSVTRVLSNNKDGSSQREGGLRCDLLSFAMVILHLLRWDSNSTKPEFSNPLCKSDISNVIQ